MVHSLNMRLKYQWLTLFYDNISTEQYFFGDVNMVMTDQEFLKELNNHPILKARFKEMLSIAANNRGDLITRADDAEYAVIDQVRKAGQELLQDWASKESKRVSSNVKSQIKDANMHVKKNSGGTQHMV